MKFKVAVIVLAIIITGMAIVPSCGLPGQLGDPTSIGAVERAVGPGSQVIKVAAGYNFSMAIVRDSKGNQTLWEIGYNGLGQLGINNGKDCSTWKNSGLKNVTLVACAGNHAMCVANNRLYVTGSNYKGQLGIGRASGIAKTWTQTRYGNISALACGDNHNMFVSWGVLWVAGDNYYGQLGLDPGVNPYVKTWTPTQTNDVSKIACGSFHSMYIGDNNKNLYVAGISYFGQLGLGFSGGNVTQWTKASNINAFSIADVSCGKNHSMIKAYGPLLSNPGIVSDWIWVTGDNQFGQVGLPSSTSGINTWQQLAYGNIGFISCGNDHSMFTSGGNLWVTGQNWYGQLGIGSTVHSYGWQPTNYGNIYAGISAGGTHNLFISQRQTWGAGNNTYHQLGVNGFNDSYSPWFLQN